MCQASGIVSIGNSSIRRCTPFTRSLYMRLFPLLSPPHTRRKFRMSEISKSHPDDAANAHASQETSDSAHEQKLMFLIGLRLLGEPKAQRFLAYVASLLEQRTPSGKEGE